MITRAYSAATMGISAHEIQVEVDIASGLPQFQVVGLPDVSVKESKERVRAAIKNSGYSFPLEKITVNLAPADIKKEGSAFDLPIALGILAATETIPAKCLDDYTFLGELALDGSLRPFPGAIVIANDLHPKRPFIFPEWNAREAALEQRACVYSVKNLKEVIEFLQGNLSLKPVKAEFFSHSPELRNSDIDFSEVKGQESIKRAIEIAVAGGHNILLIGPPGAGKTMLARRIPSILPPLEFHEAMEITKIYSAAGLLNSCQSLMRHRPFRAPHHSISSAAMAGGGSWPRPGEISLAHGGVLFLDEFPEFRRDVLECLRGPLEDGEILISRAKTQIAYPAHVSLIAAMNPCPCGFLSDPRKACRCSLNQIQKYQMRISGPILDRIDLHIEVPALSYPMLQKDILSENSESIRNRILNCRSIQTRRYHGNHKKLNARMNPRELKTFAALTSEGRKLLEAALKELRLSARAYFKILKVARTISDLSQNETIGPEHIAEAIQYRYLDRQWF